MAKIKTKPFDPAELLTTSRARALYLSEAFATGDPAFTADAFGVVARAKGMTKVARATGLSRESLYRSLSVQGNPELSTLLSVVKALGLRLQAGLPDAAVRSRGPGRRSSPARTVRPAIRRSGPDQSRRVASP